MIGLLCVLLLGLLGLYLQARYLRNQMIALHQKFVDEWLDEGADDYAELEMRRMGVLSRMSPFGYVRWLFRRGGTAWLDAEAERIYGARP